MTAKQQRFVDEYLIDLNATQAAIRSGYSEKTAEQTASRMLSFVKVQNAIQEAMKQREERTKITQDRVLEELAKIAFANITDYLEYKTNLRIIGYKDGEQAYEWAVLVNTIDSSEVDGSPIQEVSMSKDGAFRFKLHNKLTALELLAKHLGMFHDRWFENDDNEMHIVITRASED